MKVCKEIESFEELVDEFGDNNLPEIDQGDFWCYHCVVTETDQLHSSISVVDYLDILSQDSDVGESIITYSVSSLEERYKEWVQAALDLQPVGATVTVLDRGNRFVYLCSIPSSPQELM